MDNTKIIFFDIDGTLIDMEKKCVTEKLFVLRLCRVVVHQQLPFPLHADAEPQPGQSEQCFALVPPQPQSCRQKADHAALGGFTARLAGLKFGVRAPRL